MVIYGIEMHPRSNRKSLHNQQLKQKCPVFLASPKGDRGRLGLVGKGPQKC